MRWLSLCWLLLLTSPALAQTVGPLRGTVTATTTAAATIIAAAGSGLKTYVTNLECGRDDTGTTAVTLTFNDSAATKLVLPNQGSGTSLVVNFTTPIVTAANTIFTVTSGTATTTIYCSAQGYAAP